VGTHDSRPLEILATPSLTIDDSTASPHAHDAFGNMKESGNYSFLPGAYTTANQMIDWRYDQAGNLLSDALGNSYAWRADEMLSWSNGTSYSYNAEGERAGKSGPAPTDTVYFTGRPLARYAGGAIALGI
jgi:hypothetical protein